MSEPRFTFTCDGVAPPVPAGSAGWKAHTITTRGPDANLNLEIEHLDDTVLAHVSDRGADLVRIAAHVYAADQMTSRGGEKDVHRQHWRRRMRLGIPVSDPDHWSCETVRSRLEQALSFLTDDAWEFHFAPAPLEERQIPLPAGNRELHGRPDAVVLFSGGADSLCAAIESYTSGQRPLLVSHRPSPAIDARQRALRDELRTHLCTWAFPHIGVAIHRLGKNDPSGYTQRTRAFLYAAIGASIASELGVKDVILADNGIVSLNLPITEQAVGALASRGTHPMYLALVNDLLDHVFPSKIMVSNPLWSRTRAEVLQVLRTTGTECLLVKTNSCAHHRGRPKAQPYCGVCSQCVDRRFGVIGAGLEAFDPVDQYGTDIFVQSLATNEARVIAPSFVRFAWRLSEMTDDDLFRNYLRSANRW
jgi:7-cyano-7-deazaguanine synthase in queuosine biosynthesis